MSNPRRRYYDNGQISAEAYWENGDWHRTDGPARITWYKNGQKEYEAYYMHGKHHRTDGPAVTYWDEDGELDSEEFWLNNEWVTAYDVFGDTPEAFAYAMKN